MTTGWQTRTLCEVSDTFDGPHATPKTVDSGPIYLGISALQDGVINLSDTRHVTDDDFTVWTRRVRPQANDVVFSYETRIGQAAIIPDGLECCLGRRMGLIRFNPEKVIPRFFLYQYISPQFRNFLESKTIRGATVDRISIKDFPSFPILVAPLSEQRRIVAILDKAFEAIAVARANAEQNRQNARALFESYLQSVFSQRGEGWVNKKLGDACVVERGSSPRPIKQYLTTDSDGVNWIKIGDTEQGGKYVYSSSQKITPEGAKQSRLVREGDFILTNSMSLGRPYIMKTSGYIHDGWFVLRLGKDIDPEFFYYLLSSTYVQNQFHTLAAGAIVKNISGDLVKKALLPIPTLEQQKLLVKGFITFSAQTQRLESLYQRKIAALDELKQSLLQQAFSGQL
ncbi:restriction endonuclease subunit S [Aeromonas caviae]|uniref:restriction endonuclease subunit S n=1 Tax=Aeromonas caviae TaxID=648 RepID=UPI002447EB16|nr:restriction endonuclease subunit S [Aeromonas caviae]MDH1222385.1 restriction endonuclease subunit S [Aeromonas caviae]